MYELHPIARAFHDLQRPILDAAFHAGEPRPRIPTIDQAAALSSATDVLARISTAAQTARAEAEPTLAGLEDAVVAADEAYEAAEAAFKAAQEARNAARHAFNQAKNVCTCGWQIPDLLSDPPALIALLNMRRGNTAGGEEVDHLVQLGLARFYPNAGRTCPTPDGSAVIGILRQCVGPA